MQAGSGGEKLTAMTRFAPVFLAVAALSACGKPPEKVEDIRPVRVTAVEAARGPAEETFSGEVRARIETAMGFRVGGKVVAREVDVGSEIRPGQVLARLDPGDLKLGAASANAQLNAARAQLELASSDLKRQRVLLDRGHISQAAFDRYESQFSVARSQVEAQASQARERGNQAAYATLAADRAGVIIAVEAEPGQVVQTGQPVFRIAQAGEREIAIAVPEVRVGLFQSGTPVTVASWAEPERHLAGVVREVAAAADPATRSYRVRVSVPEAPASLRLGMTATVSIAIPQAGRADPPVVPLPALVSVAGSQSVWVLDPKSTTVSRRIVEIGGISRDGVQVTAGLTPGDLVVVAGANLLRPGQRVAVTGPGTGTGTGEQGQRIAQVAP